MSTVTQHGKLGDANVDELLSLWVECAKDIGEQEFEMKIEERGEPWLGKQIMKSNKLSRRMGDYDINGFGRNRRGGIDYMILIAEMQIYKDEENKARAEGELLPEKILARKIAQRGLAHSTPPATGGWKRNER